MSLCYGSLANLRTVSTLTGKPALKLKTRLFREVLVFYCFLCLLVNFSILPKKFGFTKKRCRELNFHIILASNELIYISDVFHKFDGVVNKDSKSKNVVGYFKDIFSDFFTKSEKLYANLDQFVHFFSYYYLVFDHPNCVIDMVNRCELLYYQLRKIYFLDAAKIYLETDSKRMVCGFNAFLFHVCVAR